MSSNCYERNFDLLYVLQILFRVGKLYISGAKQFTSTRACVSVCMYVRAK